MGKGSIKTSAKLIPKAYPNIRAAVQSLSDESINTETDGIKRNQNTNCLEINPGKIGLFPNTEGASPWIIEAISDDNGPILRFSIKAGGEEKAFSFSTESIFDLKVIIDEITAGGLFCKNAHPSGIPTSGFRGFVSGVEPLVAKWCTLQNLKVPDNTFGKYLLEIWYEDSFNFKNLSVELIFTPNGGKFYSPRQNPFITNLKMPKIVEKFLRIFPTKKKKEKEKLITTCKIAGFSLDLKSKGEGMGREVQITPPVKLTEQASMELKNPQPKFHYTVHRISEGPQWIPTQNDIEENKVSEENLTEQAEETPDQS